LGNNTHLYGLANPLTDLTNTDASGLLVRGNGLSNQQWAEIQQAKARFRKVAGRACTCNSDGSSGSCIPCNIIIIPDLLDYLDRSVVHDPLTTGTRRVPAHPSCLTLATPTKASTRSC